MHTDNDLFLIKHIIKECEFLKENSKKITYYVFIDDATLMRAFERSIEIIGEASKKLSNEFKQSHPEINWRAVAGMRDKLIHEYFGVDHQIVWDVASVKSIELLDFFKSISKDLPSINTLFDKL